MLYLSDHEAWWHFDMDRASRYISGRAPTLYLRMLSVPNCNFGLCPSQTQTCMRAQSVVSEVVFYDVYIALNTAGENRCRPLPCC